MNSLAGIFLGVLASIAPAALKEISSEVSGKPIGEFFEEIPKGISSVSLTGTSFTKSEVNRRETFKEKSIKL